MFAFIFPHLKMASLCWLLIAFSSSINANDEFRLLSQNLHRFFDDVDNGKKYETVLTTQKFHAKAKLAAYKIINDFKLPDIIALQEVDNMNTLNQLINYIRLPTGRKYRAILKAGNDVSNLNIAFLINPEFQIKSVRQLFKNERVKRGGIFLFSRPPLFVRVCKQSNCISILNLHLRSMLGIASEHRGKRVRLKRWRQAATIARWINQYQRANPSHSLMVMGDLNALSPTDPYVDVIGTIKGKPDNRKVLISSKDWIESDLIDLTQRIPENSRYSYIFRKEKLTLDYMLVNQVFKPRLKNIQFSPIDYQFSDHAGLIADFHW